MGHAACELANCLHFLTLNKLGFEALEFGCVVQHRHKKYFAIFDNPRQRDLNKNLFVRARQSEEFRPPQPLARGGIGQPIRDRPSQPFHQVDKAVGGSVISMQQVAGAAVGFADLAARRHFKQWHRQSLEPHVVRCCVRTLCVGHKHHFFASHACRMHVDRELLRLTLGPHAVGLTRPQGWIGDQIFDNPHAAARKVPCRSVHPENRATAPDGHAGVDYLGCGHWVVPRKHQFEPPHQCCRSKLMRNEPEVSILQNDFFGADPIDQSGALHAMDETRRIGHVITHDVSQHPVLDDLEGL